MGFKEWLVPQYENIKEKQKRIKDIEHQGDDFVHEIFHELNKSFITPIDHEDISSLASAFDDILDHIDGTAIRLVFL